MKLYNNYDNFDKVLTKIKKESNRASFGFLLSEFPRDDNFSIESSFADLMGSYFSYAYDNKEETENLISTVVYELIDYFSFISIKDEDLKIDFFDGIEDKYFLIEFNDIQLGNDCFQRFNDLLNNITSKSVRDEYISILEDNKKEIYLEKNFCILFLVADYKAKIFAEIDEIQHKINTFKILIKL